MFVALAVLFVACSGADATPRPTVVPGSQVPPTVDAGATIDAFKHLKEGGDIDDLTPKEANSQLLRQVNRTDDFIEFQEKYLRG